MGKGRKGQRRRGSHARRRYEGHIIKSLLGQIDTLLKHQSVEDNIQERIKQQAGETTILPTGGFCKVNKDYEIFEEGDCMTANPTKFCELCEKYPHNTYELVIVQYDWQGEDFKHCMIRWTKQDGTQVVIDVSQQKVVMNVDFDDYIYGYTTGLFSGRMHRKFKCWYAIDNKQYEKINKEYQKNLHCVVESLADIMSREREKYSNIGNLMKKALLEKFK